MLLNFKLPLHKDLIIREYCEILEPDSDADSYQFDNAILLKTPTEILVERLLDLAISRYYIRRIIDVTIEYPVTKMIKPTDGGILPNYPIYCNDTKLLLSSLGNVWNANAFIENDFKFVIMSTPVDVLDRPDPITSASTDVFCIFYLISGSFKWPANGKISKLKLDTLVFDETSTINYFVFHHRNEDHAPSDFYFSPVSGVDKEFRDDEMADFFSMSDNHKEYVMRFACFAVTAILNSAR